MHCVLLQVILKYMFSHVGLAFLSMFYGVVGANLYIAMEKPDEEKRCCARSLFESAIFIVWVYNT